MNNEREGSISLIINGVMIGTNIGEIFDKVEVNAVEIDQKKSFMKQYGKKFFPIIGMVIVTLFFFCYKLYSFWKN